MTGTMWGCWRAAAAWASIWNRRRSLGSLAADGRQDLHRDPPPERDLLGLVDDADPPAPISPGAGNRPGSPGFSKRTGARFRSRLRIPRSDERPAAAGATIARPYSHPRPRPGGACPHSQVPSESRCRSSSPPRRSAIVMKTGLWIEIAIGCLPECNPDLRPAREIPTRPITLSSGTLDS